MRSVGSGRTDPCRPATRDCWWRLIPQHLLRMTRINEHGLEQHVNRMGCRPPTRFFPLHHIHNRQSRCKPRTGCVRLTDVSVVGESPTERKGSHHFHREPCACHREVSGEASVAACAGQAIEPRNRLCRMRRDFPGNRRQHFTAALG